MEQRTKLSPSLLILLPLVAVSLCVGVNIVTDLVCEGSTLVLSCEDGKVLQIYDSLYGREKNDVCPGPNSERTSNCRAENSLSTVSNRCANRTSCEVPARNRVFGDPCVGTYKYLVVNYSCAAISISCSQDVVYISGVSLRFTPAKMGETVESMELCPLGSPNSNVSLATRYCGDGWNDPVVTECYDATTADNQIEQIAKMNITDDNVKDVSEVLFLASSQENLIKKEGLDNIITAIDSIVQVGNPSTEVTDSVIGVVNNLMSLNEMLLKESSNVNEVVPLLEKQVRLVHSRVENYSELVQNLGVSTFRLEKTSSVANSFVFDDPFMGSDYYDDNDTRRSSISLPTSLFDIIDRVNQNLTLLPVSLITYRDAVLYQPDFEFSDIRLGRETAVISEYVNSHVISANVDVEGVEVKNLPQNSSVVTRFSRPMIDEGNNQSDVSTEFVCVFWKYYQADGQGRWSDKGCRRISDMDDSHVVCSCNHLTSFTVLVRVSELNGDDEPKNKRFMVALSVISTAGCVISIVGLSFSVLAMILIKSIRKKQQTHVHFNLCLALLGLYLSFLLGIERTDVPDLCRFMTSLIYFFCLSSVAWMSVEAFYIYMVIWKYKRNSVRHLLTISILLAWGLPAVGATVIFFFSDGGDNDTTFDYCFLHPGPILYFGFLLEVFFLSCYNCVVFVLATYRVSCRKIRHITKEEKREEVMSRLRSTFLFWIFLGMSWTFGFLATFQNTVSLPFQILFCLGLSLQGFFMFYMLFVQNPEMKKILQSPIKRSATSSFGAAGGTKSANTKSNPHFQSHDMQNVNVESEYEFV